MRMLFAIFAFSLVTGCAGLGQYPAAHTGTITTTQRVDIPRATFGRPILYGIDTPTNAVFTVQNGTDKTYTAYLECVDLMEYDIEVPPYTAQQISVVTTLRRREDTLCRPIYR